MENSCFYWEIKREMDLDWCREIITLNEPLDEKYTKRISSLVGRKISQFLSAGRFSELDCTNEKEKHKKFRGTEDEHNISFLIKRD